MKLFVLTNSLEKGGAEKLLVSCLPLFKKKGLQVELILLDASRSVPEFLETVLKAGIPIHDLAMSNIYSPAGVWKIQSLIQKYRPDILHVHLFPSLYWGSLAKRLTGNSQVLFYTEHSNHNKRRDKAYLNPIERYFYAPYNQLIAITDSVKDKLGEWIGDRSKIQTILNGVDIKSIQSVPKTEREDFAREFNLPMPARVLFMAASFRYPKDQTTVLKAIKTLGPGYHLLLAGEGPLLDEVKQACQELNLTTQTHFLGFRTDATRIMKSVDLNILSSYYEGMSGVTLESLASGVPFLGSDVAGIQEIVPDQRFLFEKANAEELAARIHAITSDSNLYEEMTKLATEFVAQYDMDVMAERYIQAYQAKLAE